MAVACRQLCCFTHPPAAPLKPGVGLPSTRNAPSNSRAYRTAGHTGQPGIPGSRAAGHTGQPGIPGSRAYRAAGQPGIPGSRAYRAAGHTGQPGSRAYRAAGHTGQPGIPGSRAYRIPTPAAQQRSQQTPLARPQTGRFLRCGRVPSRASLQRTCQRRC